MSIRDITNRYRDSLADTRNKDMFSLGYQWADKPHRHVYDLCRLLEDMDRAIEERIVYLERYEYNYDITGELKFLNQLRERNIRG